MKTLFLLLAGISLLATGSTVESTAFNSLKAETINCPECTKKYNECVNPLHNAYTTAVVKAADKLKEGKITKEEYSTACAEARGVRNKGITACTTEYYKCCLAETKVETKESL